MTLKVGKIEISSDQAKTQEEFFSLVDGLAQRITQLLDPALTLEGTQPTTPTTTAAATPTAAVQTVTTV